MRSTTELVPDPLEHCGEEYILWQAFQGNTHIGCVSVRRENGATNVVPVRTWQAVWVANIGIGIRLLEACHG